METSRSRLINSILRFLLAFLGFQSLISHHFTRRQQVERYLCQKDALIQRRPLLSRVRVDMDDATSLGTLSSPFAGFVALQLCSSAMRKAGLLAGYVVGVGHPFSYCLAFDQIALLGLSFLTGSLCSVGRSVVPIRVGLPFKIRPQ